MATSFPYGLYGNRLGTHPPSCLKFYLPTATTGATVRHYGNHPARLPQRVAMVTAHPTPCWPPEGS